MRKTKIEKKINHAYSQLSFTGKIIIVSIILFSLIGNIILVSSNFRLSNRLYATKNKYKTDLDRAKDSYFLLNLENANLEKKIQNLYLELAETLNNTVELQIMMNHVTEENLTLYSIKDELADGINKTSYQLKKMQKSVNDLIVTRQKSNEKEQELILKQNNK